MCEISLGQNDSYVTEPLDPLLDGSVIKKKTGNYLVILGYKLHNLFYIVV